MEYVREHREEPLTVLAGNTLKVVQAWFGEQEQPDDMTIVLARSCAESCADGGRSYADGGS
jgi:sigma-B regulation protein RsbU (phosphoserine phosphatase)